MKARGLEDVFRALNESGTRYLVAGGLAVVAHGYIRLTMDVDLVIQLEASNLQKAMAALKQLGYRPKAPVDMMDFASPDKREAWIKEKGMVVFQVVSDQYETEPVDIFVSEPFDFNEEYEHAPRFELADEVRIPVVRLKALLAMKREANRPKDQIDLLYLEQRQIEHGGS